MTDFLMRLLRLCGEFPGICGLSLVFCGEGLSEMRIHHGPGYRVYYKDTGMELIILLCGGDKSTQAADIAKAKELVNEPLEDEEAEEGSNENS
jgi:putative addiction module killer protein